MLGVVHVKIQHESLFLGLEIEHFSALQDKRQGDNFLRLDEKGAIFEFVEV